MTTWLGFDIMGALVFGSDFRSVQEEENRDLADSVLPASQLLYWVSYLPLAAIVRPLLRTKLFEIVGGKPVTDNNRLIAYANSQVQAQKLNNDGNEKGISSLRRDFLSGLVAAEDKKTGWHPTSADLDAESLNMINAGADPYSSVLAASLFYLVHNEHALQKATAEVRYMYSLTQRDIYMLTNNSAAFSSPDEIRNGTQLNSCDYMYACIEETLRRTAGVPSHLPRVVLPGGIQVDGQHLPEGTMVGVSAYALHHTPEYFPDPWVFKPERWIESDIVSKKSIVHSRKAFTPFGTGVRQCAGKNLAYLQMKLTLAHLLWKFDMRLAPDEPGRGCGGPELEEGRHRRDEFQMIDALGFGRDGPMVEFKNAKLLSQ